MCRLVYGLDYEGNVCGDRRAKPNLNHFQVRYWMNPSQLYWSGVYPDRYKLSTARSICLRNCGGSLTFGDFNLLQINSSQSIEGCMIIGSFCGLTN
jgi:hypothetical protein